MLVLVLYLPDVQVCAVYCHFVCSLVFVSIREKSEVVMHSDDAFAPVAYLRLTELRLQDKDGCHVCC